MEYAGISEWVDFRTSAWGCGEQRQLARKLEAMTSGRGYRCYLL
jgi:hypothetical protein